MFVCCTLRWQSCIFSTFLSSVFTCPSLITLIGERIRLEWHFRPRNNRSYSLAALFLGTRPEKQCCILNLELGKPGHLQWIYLDSARLMTWGKMCPEPENCHFWTRWPLIDSGLTCFQGKGRLKTDLRQPEADFLFFVKCRRVTVFEKKEPKRKWWCSLSGSKSSNEIATSTLYGNSNCVLESEIGLLAPVVAVAFLHLSLTTGRPMFLSFAVNTRTASETFLSHFSCTITHKKSLNGDLTSLWFYSSLKQLLCGKTTFKTSSCVITSKAMGFKS